jgi:hypothetical protein
MKKHLNFLTGIFLVLIKCGLPVSPAAAKGFESTLVYQQTPGHYSFDTTLSKQGIVSLFVPGEIPGNLVRSAAPAFSPGGDMLYMGKSSEDGAYVIFVCRKVDGKWSVPGTASFSGRYRDLEPAYSPDGKYLIFASSRPGTPDSTQLEGHYNGQTLPGKGGNLWKVNLTAKNPGKPERLADMVNSNSSVFSPAITGDGSLYFMRADSGARFHIYRSQMKNGEYETPVKASFTLSTFGDYDPAVAPDESFLIFSSARAPAPKTADLFIVFRTLNGWSEPIDLRSVFGDQVYGVEARLSSDLETLYFSNSRNVLEANTSTVQSTWKVNIRSLLESHGIKSAIH